MPYSWITYVIVCVGVFLAGFVDSIGGGGGLISLPAYLIAGIPAHLAIGTNKLSSTCGTTLSTIRFIRHKLVLWKAVIPAILAAILGSALGSRLSITISESILEYALLVILPITAILVLNRNLFCDHSESEFQLNARSLILIAFSSFVIGIYDGLYGPGTGTFLIIAFSTLTHMSIQTANAESKVINLTTNITSLLVFLMHGQVNILIGLLAACFNMAGNYFGSGLVMNKGVQIVRPVILTVVCLFVIRIVWSLF